MPKMTVSGVSIYGVGVTKRQYFPATMRGCAALTEIIGVCSSEPPCHFSNI